MRWPYPHRSKSRHQFGVAAFTPGDPIHCCFGKLSANSLTDTGFRAASRRINFGGRPLPLQRIVINDRAAALPAGLGWPVVLRHVRRDAGGAKLSSFSLRFAAALRRSAVSPPRK
jgi:hypothetical protein